MSRKLLLLNLIIASLFLILEGCNNKNNNSTQSKDSLANLEQTELPKITLPIGSFLNESQVIGLSENDSSIIMDRLLKPCSQNEFDVQSKGLISDWYPSEENSQQAIQLVRRGELLTIINQSSEGEIENVIYKPIWNNDLGLYVLYVGFWEDFAYLFIDKESGKVWNIAATPQYFPGESHFTATYLTDPYDEESDSHLQLFKVTKSDSGKTISFLQDYHTSKNLYHCFYKGNKIYISYYTEPYSEKERVLQYGLIER